MIQFSTTEKDFIISGISQNVRLDGRQRLNFRQFSLSTGVVANANGSSKVQLDNTTVLVGIKLELGSPDDKKENEGKIMFNIDCSPSLKSNVVTKHIQSTFMEILTNSIDLTKLCVVKGTYCWIVYIDCLILDYSGNIFDALSICIKAALHDTKIPAVEVVEIDNQEDEVIISDELSEFLDFPAEKVPVTITFGIFKKHYVVDPSLEEESCMNSALTLSVCNEGKIFSIHKRDFFGVNPSQLIEVLKAGQKIGKNVLLLVLDVLKKEKEKVKKKEIFLDD